jgi:hypothetical protein
MSVRKKRAGTLSIDANGCQKLGPPILKRAKHPMHAP